MLADLSSIEYRLQNAAQQPDRDSLVTRSSCAELNRQIMLKAERGELSKAEDALLPAIADEGRTDPACAGLLLNNLAAILSVSGRFTEAEAIARRSVAVFESILTPDSAVLLRPLQILSGRPHRTRQDRRSPGKRCGRWKEFA